MWFTSFKQTEFGEEVYRARWTMTEKGGNCVTLTSTVWKNCWDHHSQIMNSLSLNCIKI